MKDLEQRLNLVLSDLERRISNLEDRVSKIPDPIVLYYRSPESDKHERIDQALDMLYTRLNILEEMSYQ